MSLPENDSREAQRWTKWAVSVVIALHFFAILTAVTGLGVGYAPPPGLCAEANQKFAPYLELVFLQNPYRFYAPNPGCDPTMWVRIRYSDGNVRWLEFPGPSESAVPVLRQRLMAMPRTAVETVPVGEAPDDVMLTPTSRICLASYVRGLVRSHVVDSANGLPVLTEDVEVYRVDQRCMRPFEAREGWRFTDLRLREATYLGTCFVNGMTRDGPRGQPVPMHDLAARVVQESVGSSLQPSGSDPSSFVLAESMLPLPIVALLQEHPELATSDARHLSEHVRTAIEGPLSDEESAEPLPSAVDETVPKRLSNDRRRSSSPISGGSAVAASSR